jgi:hypothetical protein
VGQVAEVVQSRVCGVVDPLERRHPPIMPLTSGAAADRLSSPRGRPTPEDTALGHLRDEEEQACPYSDGETAKPRRRGSSP